MKILVFEYITGGGFNKRDLPESLASEGRLMLQTLLDGLSAIHGIELMVMLDWRLSGSLNLWGIHKTIIKPEHDCHQQFVNLAGQCDAVWPIAPEFDGLLESLSLSVEHLGKVLLASSARSVAITADKFKTCQFLRKHNIATVPTRLFDGCYYDDDGECMIKPVDGAGCADNYLVRNRADFAEISANLPDSGRFVIQPYVQGEKSSLSCLFKQGKAWLLCANLQKFRLIDRRYHLSGIEVNHQADLCVYRVLVGKLAEALPDLWGCVGIDLIETADQVLVLEINPRITTSFAGIADALGMNVAALVLQLLRGDPFFIQTRNLPITINIDLDGNEN